MNKSLMMSLAIIGIAAIFGLYNVIPVLTKTFTTYSELNTAKTNLTQTQQQIEEIKKAKASHDLQEKNSAKPVYKNEISTDDPMSSFGVMFEDVIQAAKYNKLKLYSIAYNMAPADDMVYSNIPDDYNVCEVTMQLIGKYPEFKSYFQDIYNYPYLINLSKVEIKPYERDKTILIGDVKVVLYSKKG